MGHQAKCPPEMGTSRIIEVFFSSTFPMHHPCFASSVQCWAHGIFLTTRHRIMLFYWRVTRHQGVFDLFSGIIAVLRHSSSLFNHVKNVFNAS